MDRRFLLGVALMVLIALAPSILFKKQPKPVSSATQPADSGAGGQGGGSPVLPPPAVAPAAQALPPRPPAPLPHQEDTVAVSSGSIATPSPRGAGDCSRWCSMSITRR